LREFLDSETFVFYLQVPSSMIVLLQGYFESYEDLGLVRTLDAQSSLVCVITTPSMKESCENLLLALRSELPWREAEEIPGDELKQRYLGYFSGNN